MPEFKIKELYEEIDGLVAEIKMLKQKNKILKENDKMNNYILTENFENERTIRLLQQENKHLIDMLNIAYTLASRHYQNGAMENIKKLLDESKA